MSAQPMPLEEELIPALFQHSVDAYALMEQQARQVGTQMIWEGHLTKLITKELHFSVPYYSSIRSALIRMGCIVQTKRGGGNAESQYILVRVPTLELYREEKPLKKPGTQRVDSLEQQMRALNERMIRAESLIRIHNQLLEFDPGDAS